MCWQQFACWCTALDFALHLLIIYASGCRLQQVTTGAAPAESSANMTYEQWTQQADAVQPSNSSAAFDHVDRALAQVNNLSMLMELCCMCFTQFKASNIATALEQLSKYAESAPTVPENSAQHSTPEQVSRTVIKQVALHCVSTVCSPTSLLCLSSVSVVHVFSLLPVLCALCTAICLFCLLVVLSPLTHSLQGD